jgi:hypothetical protein
MINIKIQDEEDIFLISDKARLLKILIKSLKGIKEKD